MTTSSSQQLRHTITTKGPATGLTFTGRTRFPAGRGTADLPLVIALHGGTYTSEYFDIPGHSLLNAGAVNGVPVIAIDRPGYGGSTRIDGAASLIDANAEVIDHLITELWTAYGRGLTGVVLIGHSIGAAIATAISARQPGWPLLGVAISGSMLPPKDEPDDTIATSTSTSTSTSTKPVVAADAEYSKATPQKFKDWAMFGPEWTIDDRMPEASHTADSLTPNQELIDFATTWVRQLPVTAAEVHVPIQIRQAEFDNFWIADKQPLSDYAAQFTHAPRVDARVVHSAGHCIDFHRVGRAFQLDQLAFALACCAPSPTD